MVCVRLAKLYETTYGAIKTLSMIRATHCFKVFVTSFNRKVTPCAFRLKHASKIWTRMTSFVSSRNLNERDYLRRSMVLLLQHEMFLFQSTSCTQCRGNIRDANFSPGLERIPRMPRRIDGAFEKILCLPSRSSESIWHSQQRVFARNLSRSTICHCLPRTHSRRDRRSSANRWSDWRRSNGRSPKWMDLYRSQCCTRIDKIISGHLPYFDSTGMTDSDLIGSVVLIQ